MTNEERKAALEAIISNLLHRFERGTLTRRELVQGLAMLTAASGTVSDSQAQDAGIKGTKIDRFDVAFTQFGFEKTSRRLCSTVSSLFAFGGASRSRVATR